MSKHESTAYKVFEKVRIISKLINSGSMEIDTAERVVCMRPELYSYFNALRHGMDGLMQSATFFIHTAHAINEAEKLAVAQDVPPKLSPEREKEIVSLILEIKPIRFAVVGQSGDVIVRGIFENEKTRIV